MNNKSSTVNIQFGISNGKLVHISEVPRGLACKCICSKCGNVLKARKGPIKAWHFSHHVNSLCPGGGISDIHRYAQELLIQSKYVYVPKIEEVGKIRINFQNVAKEVQTGKYRCDNVGTTNDSKEYYIEFHYKNPCEQEKLTYYKRNSLRSIEIHLDNILELENSDKIKNYILKDSSREWIYAPILNRPFWTDEEKEDLKELGKEVFHWLKKQVKKTYNKLFK